MTNNTKQRINRLIRESIRHEELIEYAIDVAMIEFKTTLSMRPDISAELYSKDQLFLKVFLKDSEISRLGVDHGTSAYSPKMKSVESRIAAKIKEEYPSIRLVWVEYKDLSTL